MSWRIYFEPRDIWVGVYWTTRWETDNPHDGAERWLDVYICVLPCLPVRVTTRLRRSQERR